MTTPTTEAQWTWGQAVRAAHNRLEERGLHRLRRPLNDPEDLGGIPEIDKLGDETLANMLARAHAWHAYATVELAYALAELGSFDEIYEIKLGEEMNRVGKNQDGQRVVKDVLRSISIMGSETLTAYHRKRTELSIDKDLLQGLVKGMEIQARALESEAIRRASTRRLEGGRF